MTEVDIADRVIAGEQAALGQVISKLVNRGTGFRDLVARLHESRREARVIGITGSPGTGKSTLVDGLVSTYRDRGLDVGVISVDPTSPFSGGAILGDRIRMQSARRDPGVFVRSLSTRGALGGLSPAIDDVITAYEAFGMDRIIVETVGAGQNEVDIVRSADSVVVVVQPSHGDEIQLLKAGIIEIGDLYVVNKADLPGADRAVEELSRMLADASSASCRQEDEWVPPIIQTIATEANGIPELEEALDNHYQELVTRDALADRRRKRVKAHIQRILRDEIRRDITEAIDEFGGIDTIIEAVRSGENDPYSVASAILTNTSEDEG